MEQMVAVCGLECQNCGAFLATQNNDEQKRLEVAKEWSEKFTVEIKPEDVYCDGCRSQSGVLFQHCHVCEIRRCSLAKGVENCAHCPDYTCEQLLGFFKMAPEAKTILDGIRSTVSLN